MGRLQKAGDNPGHAAVDVGREGQRVNRVAKAQRFNVSDYLVDARRVIAAYLAEAFRSGDVRLIAKAIGALARALIAQMKSPTSRRN